MHSNYIVLSQNVNDGNNFIYSLYIDKKTRLNQCDMQLDCDMSGNYHLTWTRFGMEWHHIAAALNKKALSGSSSKILYFVSLKQTIHYNLEPQGKYHKAPFY